jgi:hypothetical protein
LFGSPSLDLASFDFDEIDQDHPASNIETRAIATDNSYQRAKPRCIAAKFYEDISCTALADEIEFTRAAEGSAFSHLAGTSPTSTQPRHAWRGFLLRVNPN